MNATLDHIIYCLEPSLGRWGFMDPRQVAWKGLHEPFRWLRFSYLFRVIVFSSRHIFQPLLVSEQCPMGIHDWPILSSNCCRQVADTRTTKISVLDFIQRDVIVSIVDDKLRYSSILSQTFRALLASTIKSSCWRDSMLSEKPLNVLNKRIHYLFPLRYLRSPWKKSSLPLSLLCAQQVLEPINLIAPKIRPFWGLYLPNNRDKNWNV